MILNISNNTDIIRFYSNWLICKFEQGFFSIETEKQNNIYEINPKNFELLVFQTKDPTNIISYLDNIVEQGYKFFFIITLTPYNSDIEPNLDKKQVYDSIRILSERYGPDTIVWKYAPIIINNEFSIEYHQKKFKSLCKRMQSYCKYCICDFVEPYNPPVHASLYAPVIQEDVKKVLLTELTRIGKEYGIKIYSKNSKNNIFKLLKLQIKHRCGISITENPPVLDIGLSETCKGFCEYCFSGGNVYLRDSKECIDESPLAKGVVDKTKKPVKRKCPPIT